MNTEERAAQVIAEAVGQRIQIILEPLAAMTRAIDRLSVRIDDVDRRVIHLEAAHQSPEIERLRSDLSKVKGEIELIVAWKNRLSGAAGLFDWVKSSWPFLVAIVAGTVAYFKMKGDQ